MAVTKTWNTNSPRARPSHAQMSGQTVPVDSVFSNGMRWPGDSANPDETAGCTCTMSIGGEAAVPAGKSFTYDTSSAIGPWGREAYGKWAAATSTEQRAAMDFYQGIGFKEMNGSLRGLTETISDKAAAQIKPLTEAIDTAVVPENLTVFRRGKLPDNLKPGDIFSDAGFVSTSVSSGGYSEGNMQILVRKGAKAAHLSTASGSGMGDAYAELVLQRGTKFKYHGEKGGMHILEALL